MALAKEQKAIVILSTPNPLDTFSCIPMLTRGVFNCFTRKHYLGGGHVSILTYWTISERLKLIGVAAEEWHILAPYTHPDPLKQAHYRFIVGVRRRSARVGDKTFFEGQTALALIPP